MIYRLRVRGGARGEARDQAQALWELACQRGIETEIGDGLRLLEEVGQRVGTLSRFLESPRIRPETKAQMLEGPLGNILHPLLLTFLQRLIVRRRADLIWDLARDYQATADRAAGRVHAELTTALPLEAPLVARIKQKLADLLSQEVVLHPHVDPRLLGGLLVRAQDLIIDGTLRQRLETLQQRLIASDIDR